MIEFRQLKDAHCGVNVAKLESKNQLMKICLFFYDFFDRISV